MNLNIEVWIDDGIVIFMIWLIECLILRWWESIKMLCIGYIDI